MFKRRSMLFAAIGVLIFVAGALAGRAQQSRPDFMITVATGEQTGILTATCISGCQLQWSKQIAPERVAMGVSDTVTFPCPTGCKTTLNGMVVRGRQKAN